MSQLRQPMTLRDMSLQECVNLYCGACVRWTMKLQAAAQSTSSAYLQTSRSVLGECRQIQRSLSELPYSILEMMSPQLTRKFADIISIYNCEVCELECEFWYERIHDSLCTAMFRSVLTPYVYVYDHEIVLKTFTHNLVVQTLDSVPGLRALCLHFKTNINHSAPLSWMIHHLTHLEVFTYRIECTDEVTEQLGLNCSHLKKVDVHRSDGVTNASVEHLLQLRELQFLDLCETRIDSEHYALLLSELPQIKNIAFSYEEGNILDYISVENRDRISHVSALVNDISMLTQRCRNITNLDITTFQVDLSALAALTALRTLRIVRADYAKTNLNAVLTRIGPRLTDLTLNQIRRVNLQDIVMLCPSLENLTLSGGSVLPLNAGTPLDPQLPHFRNLISLHLSWCSINATIYNYIRHYVSLKTFRFHYVKFFALEFMRELVRSGTFANLEEFDIIASRPGYLTVEAVELLIQNCPHLKIIKGLKTSQHLQPHVIQKLKHRILVRNFDIDIE